MTGIFILLLYHCTRAGLIIRELNTDITALRASTVPHLRFTPRPNTEAFMSSLCNTLSVGVLVSLQYWKRRCNAWLSPREVGDESWLQLQRWGGGAARGAVVCSKATWLVDISVDCLLTFCQFTLHDLPCIFHIYDADWNERQVGSWLGMDQLWPRDH